MPFVATLNRPLNVFQKADTASKKIGRLTPGSYSVLELKKDYPTSDTDYARLDVSTPERHSMTAWACVRWLDRMYATISEKDQEEIPVPPSDGLSVPESAITRLLAMFLSFTYTTSGARYPYPIPGVSVKLAPPRRNNCCTFVEALLVRAWQDQYSDFTWGNQKHSQMMITNPSADRYSPVTAIVEKGMGEALRNEYSLPRQWNLVQGWRAGFSGGHCFLVAAYHPETDKVLTLECNTPKTLNGVGFRGIGNIREVGTNPPSKWWKLPRVPTWSNLAKIYPHRKLARLNIIDAGWSENEV